VAFVDYYEMMGLHPRADQALIEYAFRHLVKDFHPDRGGETARMAQLNVAHDVLTDPAARQAYDREWRQHYAARFDTPRAVTVNLDTRPLLVVEPTLLLIGSATDATAELSFTVSSEAGQFPSGLTILSPNEPAHPRYSPDHWLSLARVRFLEAQSERKAVVNLHIDAARVPRPRPARATVQVLGGRQRVTVHVVVLTPVVSQCPRCQKLGTPKHRFCRNCGLRLRCPSCDAPLEENRGFCGRCGAPRERGSPLGVVE
jgi:hypothetical protein